MFKFLIVTFFMFILLILGLGFSVLRTVKNIFSGGSSNKGSAQRRQSTHNSSRQSHNRNEQQHAHSKKKIIDKNEGEYIDYEEIKE